MVGSVLSPLVGQADLSMHSHAHQEVDMTSTDEDRTNTGATGSTPRAIIRRAVDAAAGAVPEVAAAAIGRAQEVVDGGRRQVDAGFRTLTLSD